MGTLDDLPPILDLRDDLRAALDETDDAIDDEVSSVYDRLEDFTERDRATQEGVLDDIDNDLLALETRLSGEAARRIEAARNRIHTYRESLDRASENLVVLDTTFRRVEDEETEVSLADVTDEQAVVSATVVNEGDPREIMAAVTFYDGDERLGEEVSDRVQIGADEQRNVEIETRVPAGADYHAVTVLDAGEHPAGA